MVTVVHDEIIALAFHLRPVPARQHEWPVLVARLLFDLLHRGIISNDRLVILGASESLSYAEDASGVVYGSLVGDRWVALFTRVAACLRERAAVPLNMCDVGRSDRAGKANHVIMIHGFLVSISFWEVYVLVVELRGKAPTEGVEDGTNRGFANERKLANVVKAIPSAEYLQYCQDLLGERTEYMHDTITPRPMSVTAVQLVVMSTQQTEDTRPGFRPRMRRFHHAVTNSCYYTAAQRDRFDLQAC